jgi:hypothetical protein
VRIELDSSRGEVTVRLIGRLQAQHISKLKGEFENSGAERVCLREVTLVDIEVVRFLIACEQSGLSIVNCAGYISEWMDCERQHGGLGATK